MHANKISKKYIIRLRSIFLQGVLLSPPQGLHSEKFSPRFISHIERYFQHLRNINVTPLEYALGSALSVNPSELIVGVNSRSQLLDICSAYRQAASLISSNLFCMNDFAYDDSLDYDPRNW